MALYYNLKWLKGKTPKFKLLLNLLKCLVYYTGLHVSSSLKRIHKGIFFNFHVFNMILLSKLKNFGYLIFPARRKSNCVKEVEKIQQKRDERRAKHLAIKEQNEQHFDTADPNWEFQAMIK